MLDHERHCVEALTRFSSGTEVQQMTAPAKGEERSPAPFSATS